jgi:tetratricopeptide (TPR) repeat protein
VSEPKEETESGVPAQAESPSAAAEAPAASGSDAETSDVETSDAAEADLPKKKKKAREAAEGEPEKIRDRNARVRAEAAEKRRSRREREQATAPRRNLDASEVMDDALARSSHAAANFLTKHFNKVQWVIVGGLVAWIGFEVYSWRHARTTEKSSDLVFKALSTENGRVGADTADVPDERGTPDDTRRVFATDQERLSAAKTEYAKAAAGVSEASAVLVDLGAAGVAYDQGQFKEAQTKYEQVMRSPAYVRDSDIKGRTLEGLGMTLEAQKNEEQALKTFRELQNMDSATFSALGLYHQARILKTQGKNEDALKLIDKAGEKLVPLKESPAVIQYLGAQLIELLQDLDANKAKELGKKLQSTEAAKLEAERAAAPGGNKITPEQMKQIQEMLQKQQQNQPPAAPAPMPGPVAPMDLAPADPAAPEGTPPSDAPPPDAPAPAPSGAP